MIILKERRKKVCARSRSSLLRKKKRNFPPYSLVDHGVIRCGEGVSPRPYLDEELYSSHLSTHKKVAFPIPTECAEYMDKVIDSTNLASYKKAMNSVCTRR